MEIRKWQDYAIEMMTPPTPKQLQQLMQDEIDELRHALAAAAPVAAPDDAPRERRIPYAVALTAIERLRGYAATAIEDHGKDRYCLNDMTMPQDVAFMWAKEIHRIEAKDFLDEAIQDAQQ